MKADLSRDTFRPENHYRVVVMQQGRVQLDADWNEQQEIHQHRAETEGHDMIGCCGAPADDAGFGIAPTSDGSRLTIGRGRYYVDGILCENEADVFFTAQPDLPDVELESEPAAYLAYLEVCQRDITVLDDPRIRETALGGPDTASRVKTVWQVKLLKIKDAVVEQKELDKLTEEQNKLRTELGELDRPDADPAEIARIQAQLDAITREIIIKTGQFVSHMRFDEWDKLTGPSSGMLSVRAQPTSVSDSTCLLPPNGGYSGLENQLYRVEIHKSGAAGEATFKWSRDNASCVFAIEKVVGPGVFQMDMSAFDPAKGLAPGQTVEISDDRSELGLRADFGFLPGCLAKVREVDEETQQVTVYALPPQLALNRHPKLRRWDSDGDIVVPAPAVNDGFLELENGVQVKFSEGDYRTGDYWLIPARTATNDVEWPPFESPNSNPIPQSPLGIKRQFCRLAVLELSGNRWALVDDCRVAFRALANDLRVKRVIAKNAYGQDFGLNHGAVLPGSALARGLRVALNQEIDPKTIDRAVCSVSVELPYLSDGTVVGFQPIILTAKVNGDELGFLNWMPEDNASRFLSTHLPFVYEAKPDTSFHLDWEIVHPPNYISTWYYAGLDVVGNAMASPLYLTKQALCISRSRLRDNAHTVSLSATDFNHSYERDVGVVFNYVDPNDLWVFFVTVSVNRNHWGAPGSSGLHVTVAHYKDGLMSSIISKALAEGGSSGISLDKISLTIKQMQNGLNFHAEVRGHGGLYSHSFRAPPGAPASLLSGTGIGLAIRSGTQARFTQLDVSYANANPQRIIPSASAGRLLSRLTVSRDLIRPAPVTTGSLLSPRVEPLADFKLSFWLLPERVDYGYGYNQGRIAIGEGRLSEEGDQ